MNRKEQFLSYIRGENCNWMGYAFDAFPFPYPMVIDPVTALDTQFSGESYVDLWGATWRHKDTDEGAIPMVNANNCVIKDLKHWRDFVKFPDLKNLDFTAAHEQIKTIDRENQLLMIPGYYGPFERLHTLLPFEDTLIGLYEEPELISEIIGALTDWRIEAFGYVIDELHPDIIHSHDDWGNASNLFFSPEIFRTYLKPHYKRLYSFIRSKGVLVQHHNDGFGRGLEEDMVDMGIDMWQGVLIQNDIPAMKRKTGKKLVYMGGLDQFKLDRCGGDPDVIRAEVRRCIDTYAPGGAFLPCYPSVMPLDMPTMFAVVEELNRYGAEWAEKNA